MRVSIFGWLDRIPFWANLPYPIKGALLRALKAAASAGVGVLVVAATEGLLFPIGTGPLVVLVITMLLQSLDKYLRESVAAGG